MKTFEQSFKDIERLTDHERKPVLAMYAKLGEEFGEIGECVNIMEGYITHKTMKEPLVGEIADLFQVAISILVKTTPGMETEARMNLFLKHLERKNEKWAAVQEGERARALPPTALQKAPAKGDHRVEQRVNKIISEQLGVGSRDIRFDVSFTDDLGADSLDLVELTMAIEDEFDFEVSDSEAEQCKTPGDAISLVNKLLGVDLDAQLEFSSAQPAPLLPHFDPADDYTERTGRYLTRKEREAERAVHDRIGFENDM